MGSHTFAHLDFTKEKGFFLLAAVASVLIFYRHSASAPLIVRPGEAIEKHNLTVSRIDPEGIWLLDNMKRALLVKNSLHTREP